MRAFYSVFIAATLALTANASTMYQRDVTTNIEPCASDLTALGSFITTSTNALNDLTYENAEAAIKIVTEDNEVLVNALRKAGVSCCSAKNLNEDDKKYVFNEASKLADEAEAITGALNKLVVEEIAESYHGDLSQFSFKLRRGAINLGRCLLARSPKEDIDEARALAKRIRIALLQNQFLYPPESL